MYLIKWQTFVSYISSRQFSKQTRKICSHNFLWCNWKHVLGINEKIQYIHQKRDIFLSTAWSQISRNNKCKIVWTLAKKRQCFVLPSTTDSYIDTHAVVNAMPLKIHKIESISTKPSANVFGWGKITFANLLKRTLNYE